MKTALLIVLLTIATSAQVNPDMVQSVEISWFQGFNNYETLRQEYGNSSRFVSLSDSKPFDFSVLFIQPLTGRSTIKFGGGYNHETALFDRSYLNSKFTEKRSQVYLRVSLKLYLGEIN
jgi:hypothetical protein